jgi:hypothetical protein
MIINITTINFNLSPAIIREKSQKNKKALPPETEKLPKDANHSSYESAEIVLINPLVHQSLGDL